MGYIIGPTPLRERAGTTEHTQTRTCKWQLLAMKASQSPMRPHIRNPVLQIAFNDPTMSENPGECFPLFFAIALQLQLACSPKTQEWGQEIALIR